MLPLNEQDPEFQANAADIEARVRAHFNDPDADMEFTRGVYEALLDVMWVVGLEAILSEPDDDAVARSATEEAFFGLDGNPSSDDWPRDERLGNLGTMTGLCAAGLGGGSPPQLNKKAGTVLRYLALCYGHETAKQVVGWLALDVADPALAQDPERLQEVVALNNELESLQGLLERNARAIGGYPLGSGGDGL